MSQKKLLYFKDKINFRTALKNKLQHVDANKKTLLFIEPYGAVNSLLKRALAKGYQLIVLSAESDLRRVSPKILEASHVAIEIDTAQESSLRELGQLLKHEWRIDAVLPGFEYFVPSAAQLSWDLKLPGLAPAKVMNLRSKYLMRSLLKKAGLAVPRYTHVQSLQELSAAIKISGLPAICKPVDAAGSVHVKKVNSLKEAKLAGERILRGGDLLWGHQLARSLLVEEYIPGKEYSAEGVIHNGKLFHCCITEKFVADQNEFVEIGHIANPPLSLQLKNSIEHYVEAVMAVLEADHCPFHAEVRLNSKGEPVLMEVAARLAGDRIGDLIGLARNINYFDAVLSTYLGDPVPEFAMEDHFAGIRFFYRPELDYYSTIEGWSEVKDQPLEELELYYAKQEAIPAFPKPLRRLGHVIMKTQDYSQLAKTLAAIDKKLIFKP